MRRLLTHNQYGRIVYRNWEISAPNPPIAYGLSVCEGGVAFHFSSHLTGRTGTMISAWLVKSGLFE